MKVIDITGQRFGRLTVVERVENTPSGKARWLCQCDCGNTTVVQGTDLRSGHTTSCDCIRRERSAAALSAVSSQQTGNKNHAYKHGEHGTKLYSVWAQMIQRCTNQTHKRYSDWGGRGINVCDEWKDFRVFRDWAIQNGYRESLSIDRIDNDKGYSPDNCRWATVKEQNNNKRRHT